MMDYIKLKGQSVGEPDAQIESAVWATFLTDVMNPWKKAEKYAENAKNCLSEMHVKAAEMSQEINDLLELSQHVSESYQRMKTEMAALDPKANEELIRSLTKQLLSIDSHLDSHSTSVQSAFDGCASYLATNQNIRKCLIVSTLRFKSQSTKRWNKSIPEDVGVRGLGRWYRCWWLRGRGYIGRRIGSI